MKILIGLVEIAGYYSNLKRGFDELNITSDLIDLGQHRYKYTGEASSRLARWIKYVMIRRSVTSRWNLPFKLVLIWLSVLLTLAAILWYDVFIFSANRTFWGTRDLWLIKRLGKQVILVSHGDDTRPCYLSYKGTQISVDEVVNLTRTRKKLFRAIECYVDTIVCLPTVAHLREGQLINFQRLGLPFDCNQDIPINVGIPKSDCIRILHAPSAPGFKGTLVIRQMIESLRSKGHRIDYVEIVNQPNVVVLAEIERCDFVVDQVYSDVPLAGFATEAACFGKPTVVGGYAQEDTQLSLLPGWIPPSHYCRPEEMEDAIEKLITDRVYRLDLGRRAHDFVSTNWSARAVAERYLRIIRGDIPQDWLFDPKNICYVFGAGLPEEKVKTLIQSVIKAGGKEALQVADKPELERALVEFAFADESAVSDLTTPDSRSQKEVTG